MTVTVLLNGALWRGVVLAAALAVTSGCASVPDFDELPPMAPDAQELRIRVDEFLPLTPAFAHAYVIRPGVVIGYTYDGARWASRRVVTDAAADILRAASDLAPLNGQRVCRGFDGNRIAIDGVIDRQRFSLTASSPEGCTDAASRTVNDLLQLTMRTAQSR